MKRLFLLLIIHISAIFSFSQEDREKITAEIVSEGKKLYRSEMASWYGTDIFLEKYKEKASVAKGYFSYVENDKAICIFYSKGEPPKVLVTISFDSTYNISTAQVDAAPRDFTVHEYSLYKIREAALADVNNDTLYKMYENTSLNLIPLIDGALKKVYVLTGSSENGVVVIGNDYLLSFDENDKLISRRSLHRNPHFFYFGSKSKGKSMGAVHTHLPETGDFITATDICTLMLYGKLTDWENHIVVSEKYVCIWNCKTNTLFTITRGAWDKINEDQKKKRNE